MFFMSICHIYSESLEMKSHVRVEYCGIMIRRVKRLEQIERGQSLRENY